MKKWLKPCERAQFHAMVKPYARNPQVMSLKQYRQHRNTSTYDHCMRVAKLCFYLNRRLPLGADEKTLIAGAMLHDFYLYDWHRPGEMRRLHGFRHPRIASRNAYAVFCLGERERGIIETHMWPLTLTKIPRSREAWLVCFADKCCAVLELVR